MARVSITFQYVKQFTYEYIIAVKIQCQVDNHVFLSLYPIIFISNVRNIFLSQNDRHVSKISSKDNIYLFVKRNTQYNQPDQFLVTKDNKNQLIEWKEIFILLLTMLKTDLVYSTIHVESKDLDQFNYRDTNILSMVKLIIEPKCELSFVVWIVTSSANDDSYRTASRHAYPNEILRSLNITRIFLLGMPKVANEQEHILEESQEYNDLLQGDFLEDYRNLTQKHLMGLKWTTSNCRGPFIMKSDDDIALDIFEISRFPRRKTIDENTISGYALRNMKPVRVASNKWFVSSNEFPGDIYPDFLSGWFYVTSLDVAKLLVSTCRKLNNFFWIDDVFITGILRQESGIEFEDLKSMYATDYRYLECCIRGAKKRLKCEFIAGPDGGKKELHIKFREFSQFCQRYCSKRTEEQSVLKTCVSAYEEGISAVNSKAEIHYL